MPDMMTSGVTMMLKSFGFDPEELKANLIAAKAEAEGYMAQVNARLAAIEARLGSMDATMKLLAALASLEEGGEDGGRVSSDGDGKDGRADANSGAH